MNMKLKLKLGMYKNPDDYADDDDVDVEKVSFPELKFRICQITFVAFV